MAQSQGNAPFAEIQVSAKQAVAEYSNYVRSVEKAATSTADLSSRIDKVEGASATAARALRSASSEAKQSQGSLAATAKAARELAEEQERAARSALSLARDQEAVARIARTTAQQVKGSARQQAQAEALMHRERAQQLREQARLHREAARAQRESAQEVEVQLRAEQKALSANQMGWISLAFVLQDATMFQHGMAQGLRATLNNLIPMAAMVGASGPVIAGLTVGAIAAQIFGDDIEEAMRKGTVSTGEFKAVLDEVLNVEIDLGLEYHITTLEQLTAASSMLRTEMENLDKTDLSWLERSITRVALKLEEVLPEGMLKVTPTARQALEDAPLLKDLRELGKELGLLENRYGKVLPRLQEILDRANVPGSENTGLTGRIKSLRAEVEALANQGVETEELARKRTELATLEKQYQDLVGRGRQQEKTVLQELAEKQRELNKELSIWTVGADGRISAMAREIIEQEKLVEQKERQLEIQKNLARERVRIGNEDESLRIGGLTKVGAAGVANIAPDRDSILRGIRTSDLVGMKGVPRAAEQIERTMDKEYLDSLRKSLGEFDQVALSLSETLGGKLAVELAKVAQVADVAGFAFGSFSQLAQQAFEASGRNNEGLWKTYQALAIAEAVANTGVAVTRALASAPPPLNFIAAAAVSAAGAAQVLSIVNAESGKVAPVGGSAGGAAAPAPSFIPAAPEVPRPNPMGRESIDYDRLAQAMAKGTQPIVDSVNNVVPVVYADDAGKALGRYQQKKTLVID